MKFDLKQRSLTGHTKATVSQIVGKRGDPAALLGAVEMVLAKAPTRVRWDTKIKRRRGVKPQARSLLLALEGVRPELRREVNNTITDIILGMKFERMLDADYLAMLIVSLRALVNGAAEMKDWKAESEFTREDFPSLNIVAALAKAWREHTRLAVSGADGAPFVEFVSAVLTQTGGAAVLDPRRLIKRVLKTDPSLRGKPKK